MMDKTESLPELYVKARNHYDVGHTIGRTFKGWIEDYMATSDDVKQLRMFYGVAKGRKFVENYMMTAKKSHPNIVSEIQGMADGANIKFEELFLLQVASEIQFCHIDEVLGEKLNTAGEGKGCTDVLVNRKHGRFIGHNDDWTEDVSPRVYIVHVTIADERDHVTEQFVSYCYPGYLAGFCFGMNKSLVISLNSLSPRSADPTGVPVMILLRSLFACSSIEECVSTMKNKPYGCAYGMNINIACINGPDMCSVEIYPKMGDTIVSVKKITMSDGADEICVFFHQNHYKHTTAEERGPCTGSRRREKRTSEMQSIYSVDDVRAILGDTSDTLEPVYRVPSASHIAPDVKTSATAIFNINEKQLLVYRSNPKLAPAPCLVIPFL